MTRSKSCCDIAAARASGGQQVAPSLVRDIAASHAIKLPIAPIRDIPTGRCTPSGGHDALKSRLRHCRGTRVFVFIAPQRGNVNGDSPLVAFGVTAAAAGDAAALMFHFGAAFRAVLHGAGMGGRGTLFGRPPQRRGMASFL